MYLIFSIAKFPESSFNHLENYELEESWKHGKRRNLDICYRYVCTLLIWSGSSVDIPTRPTCNFLHRLIIEAESTRLCHHDYKPDRDCNARHADLLINRDEREREREHRCGRTHAYICIYIKVFTCEKSTYTHPRVFSKWNLDISRQIDTFDLSYFSFPREIPLFYSRNKETYILAGNLWRIIDTNLISDLFIKLQVIKVW